MKRYSRISTLLHAIVLYSFVLSIGGSKALNVIPAFSSNQSTDHRSYFSMVSTDLLCHSTQNENFARGFNHFPVTALKNHLNVFLACTKGAELSHLNSYTKYVFYATCSIIWFGPTDIIFPFHSFW